MKSAGVEYHPGAPSFAFFAKGGNKIGGDQKEDSGLARVGTHEVNSSVPKIANVYAGCHDVTDKLSRFAGVSEAGVGRRNPERQRRV